MEARHPAWAPAVFRGLLYLIGCSLLVPGVAISAWALYTTLPYWRGESCTMALMGLLVLPSSVATMAAGALALWGAGRVGRRVATPPARELGYSLLFTGTAVTGWALSIAVPTWRGEPSRLPLDMVMSALVVMTVGTSAMVVGGWVLWRARRLAEPASPRGSRPTSPAAA